MNDKKPRWVKLWEEQFTHEISGRKPWCDGYAWSYLYTRANYRPAVVNFRNQYIPVERGQFVTSKSKLQALFGWSVKRTNSFLTSLEVGGMSVIRVTNRFIVITICNYDKFQSKVDEKEQTEAHVEEHTERIQSATDKKNQNIKNPLDFSEEIFSLRKRYTDQSLIDQTFAAISSTRKLGKIADSVWVKILRSWERFSVPQVATALRTYLEKGCAGDGKAENYLLGIIRNGGNGAGTPKTQRSEPPPPTFEQFICPNCRRKLAVRQDLLTDSGTSGCIYCLSVVKGGS